MQELSSTYFVQDRRNKHELTRLALQDQMLTNAMGGVLPEQTDPKAFQRVLDVACGTGGWLIEMAQTYPEMSLVGIDISQRTIKYAQRQAEAHQVQNQVKFYIMDGLSKLDFPAASFDMVNLRLGVSFLRTWDWANMLRELLRITRSGGTVRITDGDIIYQSNSPALTKLFTMLLSAFHRAGHVYTNATTGLTDHLPQLLAQHGCEQIQTKAHVIRYPAGTPEGEACYEDLVIGFQNARPFIEKWGNDSKDYGTIYRRATEEMQLPDFLAMANYLTVWGRKP